MTAPSAGAAYGLAMSSSCDGYVWTGSALFEQRFRPAVGDIATCALNRYSRLIQTVARATAARAPGDAEAIRDQSQKSLSLTRLIPI